MLVCLFGLLMIISAVNMHEKESIIMKVILFVIGVLALLVGGYLLIRGVLLG
ncbi:hypothetical protein FC48_GL000375 [Ligilactobacillus murinus DSM 20452 = NBRC 14221]|nr:hypothetical protein FC48_GL000375 [Ligilactobacillus murinus DSM 20452 = NBRC 14221]